MHLKTARNLTLIPLTVSALWLLSDPSYEPVLALMSALAVSATATRKMKLRAFEDAAATPMTIAHPHPERYAKTIGARLKALRADVLQLSLREMAEFLGVDQITKMERYEDGEKEYPLSLIKKIESFFRVDSRYVDSGRGSPFKHFVLSQQSVNSFISAGYTPMLVCCPSERSDLLCYQVFTRSVAGYMQVAFADRYGSFASSGGGKMNIGFLVDALLDAGMNASSVRIIKATQVEWNAIGEGSYYSKTPFCRFGSADSQCVEIFDRWFDEYRRARERWAAGAARRDGEDLGIANA